MFHVEEFFVDCEAVVLGKAQNPECVAHDLQAMIERNLDAIFLVGSGRSSVPFRSHVLRHTVHLFVEQF